MVGSGFQAPDPELAAYDHNLPSCSNAPVFPYAHFNDLARFSLSGGFRPLGLGVGFISWKVLFSPPANHGNRLFADGFCQCMRPKCDS